MDTVAPLFYGEGKGDLKFWECLFTPSFLRLNVSLNLPQPLYDLAKTSVFCVRTESTKRLIKKNNNSVHGLSPIS